MGPSHGEKKSGEGIDASSMIMGGLKSHRGGPGADVTEGKVT